MRRVVIALLALNALILALWFLLRPRDPSPAPAPSPAPTPTVALPVSPSPPPSAPEAPAPPVPPRVSPQIPHSPPRETLVHARWGSGADEFGLRRDPESNPEAPMAIAARSRDDAWVLDQNNLRLRHLRGGRVDRDVAIPSAAVQDLALARDGRVVTLDRLGAHTLRLYGPDGAELASAPLAGAGIAEPGGVTGVFTDATGVYVEREHNTLVRILDADNAPDPARATLSGRPSRDGATLLSAAMTDRAAGVVTVTARSRDGGQILWSRAVTLPDSLLHVVMLDSDAAGRVYLAAAVGHESPAPPYRILGERWLCVRIASDGEITGQIDLAVPATADETFRPVSVEDDGALDQLVPGDDGLDVIRYTFP